MISHRIAPAWKVLDWDTDFFGFRVGIVLVARLPVAELRWLLTEARDGGVTLVYWASDPADLESQEAASAMGGRLVDRKTKYFKKTTGVGPAVATELTPSIEEYQGQDSTPALEALALQSGVFSRFRMDEKFPRERFEALYREWIRKSVHRQLADAILVARDGDDLTGMVTVAQHKNIGEIGLLAVDERMRGRRLGEALVHASDRWFADHGCREWHVVTQGDNTPACRLYEKCGCSVAGVTFFYHFWL